MGLKPITLGDTVKPAAIERYRGAKGVRDIIGVLSQKIDVAYTHYLEGMGYFYHLESGICCEMCGLPAVRYIVPVVRYTVKDFKKKDYGMPVFIQYLPLAREGYEEDLLVKNELHSDITKVDLLVSCTDEKYQKLKFDVLGEAKWQRDKEIMAVLKQDIEIYKRLIGLSVAREYTEEQFLSQVEKLSLNTGVSLSQASSAQIGSGGSTTAQLGTGGNGDSAEVSDEEQKDVDTPEDFKFEDLLE